jgi:hypothetical protein
MKGRRGTRGGGRRGKGLELRVVDQATGAALVRGLERTEGAGGFLRRRICRARAEK